MKNTPTDCYQCYWFLLDGRMQCQREPRTELVPAPTDDPNAVYLVGEDDTHCNGFLDEKENKTTLF